MQKTTKFLKSAIEKIERRTGKGSFGKLIDIKYKGLTFTFHAYHNNAVDSKDGKYLEIENLYIKRRV
ncbi:MAG: hypothetical protein ACXADY_23105 [Candidatus Hodarchaeales archaeon]|jgi:hypothetical protein